MRRYADLGSTVHVGRVPPELASELPHLYNSCCSTVEYFRIIDNADLMHACELDEPRHVVVFTVDSHTAEVLNKVAAIEPACVERICRSIFRAFPKVRRIHHEVLFPPFRLRLANLVLYCADDMVVDLSRTSGDYPSMIGKSTGRHLTQYRNRLLREFADLGQEWIEGEAIDPAFIHQIAEWNITRMKKHGVPSIYEVDASNVDKLIRWAQASGVAHRVSLNGTLAAGYVVFLVGSDAWVWAGSFDPQYERLHLGLLCMSMTVADCATRGAQRVHLTWNNPGYKRRLGARPIGAWRLSVFRRQITRVRFPREALWVLRLRVVRGGAYWDLRRWVKHVLQETTARVDDLRRKAGGSLGKR